MVEAAPEAAGGGGGGGGAASEAKEEAKEEKKEEEEEEEEEVPPCWPVCVSVKTAGLLRSVEGPACIRAPPRKPLRPNCFVSSHAQVDCGVWPQSCLVLDCGL